MSEAKETTQLNRWTLTRNCQACDLPLLRDGSCACCELTGPQKDMSCSCGAQWYGHDADPCPACEGEQ